MIDNLNYRSFPAVSNSDLKAFKDEINGIERVYNEKYLAIGSLLDAMATEKESVKYAAKKLQGCEYAFTDEDFTLCQKMYNSLCKNDIYRNLVNCGRIERQHICYDPKFNINYGKAEFTLPAKCKWDMVGRNGTLGIEIKTTICKTEKQCKQAIIKFDYDQAIAWYMDLAKIEEAVIMFVSKHNFNVFNFYINKQSQYYIIGKAKYQQIAFDYWAIKSYE